MCTKKLVVKYDNFGDFKEDVCLYKRWKKTLPKVNEESVKNIVHCRCKISDLLTIKIWMNSYISLKEVL